MLNLQSLPASDWLQWCVNVVAVDLNEIVQSCGNVLSCEAALHKHAVRPRGRRASSAYQPYIVVRHEADQVGVANCVYVWELNYERVLLLTLLCTSTDSHHDLLLHRYRHWTWARLDIIQFNQIFRFWVWKWRLLVHSGRYSYSSLFILPWTVLSVLDARNRCLLENLLLCACR